MFIDDAYDHLNRRKKNEERGRENVASKESGTQFIMMINLTKS